MGSEEGKRSDLSPTGVMAHGGETEVRVFRWKIHGGVLVTKIKLDSKKKINTSLSHSGLMFTGLWESVIGLQ